ncbi:hypothetical protein [Embleya sp. NBC_00896]|nr:hypothetical protein OG928_11485 [Embleya sp. NBC_00896]
MTVIKETFASLDPATGKELARYARTQGTMKMLDRYVSLRFGRRG